MIRNADANFNAVLYTNGVKVSGDYEIEWRIDDFLWKVIKAY